MQDKNDMQNIKIDMHMHTNFTDGKHSVEEMVKAADTIGLKKIAITEHVRRDSKWIDKYIKEV
jgi:histidinol phosphatase-like PHP family hydrolase